MRGVRRQPKPQKLAGGEHWQMVGLDWCTVHGDVRLPDWGRCWAWDHDDRCEDISGSDHEGKGEENCSPCEFRPLAYRKYID